MTAIIGALSLTLADGTELTASTDVGLAREWCRAEYGTEWDGLTFGQQCSEIAEALAALRSAAS